MSPAVPSADALLRLINGRALVSVMYFHVKSVQTCKRVLRRNSSVASLCGLTMSRCCSEAMLCDSRFGALPYKNTDECTHTSCTALKPFGGMVWHLWQRSPLVCGLRLYTSLLFSSPSCSAGFPSNSNIASLLVAGTANKCIILRWRHRCQASSQLPPAQSPPLLLGHRTVHSCQCATPSSCLSQSWSSSCVALATACRGVTACASSAMPCCSRTALTGRASLSKSARATPT